MAELNLPTQISSQNELQNLLQGQKQLLDEVKLEYQEFSDVVRAEREAERKQKDSNYQKIKV